MSIKQIFKVKKYSLRNVIVSFAIVGAVSLVIGPVTNADTQGYYKIIADGQEFGVYNTRQEAVDVVAQARKQAAEKSDSLVRTEFDYDIVSVAAKTKKNNKDCTNKLCDKILEDKIEEKISASVLKVDGYSVTLQDETQVVNLLNQLVNQYDISDEFTVTLMENLNSEQNVKKAYAVPLTENITGSVQNVSFGQDIYVTSVYTVPSEIKTVDEAFNEIIAGNEINIYTTQLQQYSEEYYLDTEYIQMDSWYNSQKEVIQEAQSGVHDVTANVTYMNGVESVREIVSDNVISQPVAKVVKIGTKEAPTFIKPIRGGSFSSAFGSRWGRRHEGIDWSCSIGTSVFASSGGTISYAGWQNGYGNVIIINHGDGLRTKYAHLNSISVSSGDKVSQGDVIGKSGNTGRSTGPHLHFEILLDGEPVNPMNYL